MRIIIFTLFIVSLLISTSVLAQNTTIHSNGLTVDGTIESTNGGVVFPDGTVQETAFNYLGEFCYEMGATSLILYVSDMGDSHYIISAKHFVNGTLNNIFNGTGEIENNIIHMTLSHSGKNSGAMWSGICNVITDSVSFNSNLTLECIGHDYNYTALTLDTQYFTETANSVVCP